jgi:predicted aldo/keto reductase-like oxidoreductase
MAERTGDGIARREFLRRGALLGVGAGLVPRAVLAASEAEAPGPPHIRAKRTLGRTGLEVSDIAFGSSRLGENEDDLVRHAFDAGVNYFDTAEDYTGGAAERAIGKALQGKRDRCIVTSKVEASASGREADFMRALEGSLRRLRTDHVDVYLNHAVNDVARMKNPEWHAFVEEAKHQGKIRFSGMSGHAGRLIECLDYSLDHDLADVVLVAYNFGQDPAFYQRLMRDFDTIAVQPDLPRVIRKAAEKRVGVMTMKTLMGARLNDMRPYENGDATFAQAAFRWVLSNPGVTGVVISMTSRERIDEYLGASGAQALRAGDLPMLARYLGIQGDAYCRHACRACEEACPSGVPIGEVLRTRMYARDYGDVGFARREYAQLGAGAAACLTCTARACAGACPHGLTPETLAEESHRLLA